SIQHRLIRDLRGSERTEPYDVIFDDDGSGEAADVVGLRITGGKLAIHLYHCKYSRDGRPGARIDDLYAVFGQAQKSVLWQGHVKRLLRHLRLREIHRVEKY